MRYSGGLEVGNAARLSVSWSASSPHSFLTLARVRKTACNAFRVWGRIIDYSPGLPDGRIPFSRCFMVGLFTATSSRLGMPLIFKGDLT